jgi:CheY-like chemotaxis protein
MPAPETFEILLVEDNVHDAQLLKIAFAKCDHRVNVNHINNGEEALAFLHRENAVHPDLILIDLNLFGMQGMEFLREIKNHAVLSGLKIVVLTGSRWDGDVREVEKLNADGYVVKPTDFAGLVATANDIGSFLKGMKPLPRKMEN